MSKPILFALPGTESLATQVRDHLACDAGDLQIHQFPDGESCPRLNTPVVGRDVVFTCALDRPDRKIIAVYLSACVARELGARSVGLIVPYLPYMRQDAQFNAGEGITSRHFANLISSCCDWLVTVDPHLHRHHELADIYTIKTSVVPAAPEIAKWIAVNIDHPVIIGPDEESEQWVAQVAGAVGCPYTVLKKTRSGDREVDVSRIDPGEWTDMTPVLLDDIVSTARTMVAAAMQITSAGMAAPVCVAVHPLFVGDAYAALQVSGVARIISCNTVAHATNEINVSEAIALAVAQVTRAG